MDDNRFIQSTLNNLDTFRAREFVRLERISEHPILDVDDVGC